MRSRGLAATTGAASLVLVLGLTACTAPAADTTGSTPPGTAAVSDDWELEPAALRSMYAAKVERIREAYGLEDISTDLFERYVSAAEIAETIVSCVGEEGFTATQNATGGVSLPDVPAAQQDAFDRVLATCEAKYPIDPRFDMKLPHKRAEAQYQFLVGTVAPCVESLGYDVAVPPSEQSWLDGYYTGESVWDPVASAVSVMSPEQLETGLDEIHQKCQLISNNVYPPLDLSDVGN